MVPGELALFGLDEYQAWTLWKCLVALMGGLAAAAGLIAGARRGPLAGAVVVTVTILFLWPQPQRFLSRVRAYGGGLVVASALSVVWIWAFYFPHTMNMPMESFQTVFAKHST